MARIASEWKAGAGGRYGPLRLVDVPAPELPGPGWHRLLPRMSGICGSDLATVDGRSSRWFEPIVSFPFVPGHEVVADTEDGRAGRHRAGPWLRGTWHRAALPRLRRRAHGATAST